MEWLQVCLPEDGSGADCSSHPLHVGRKWEARCEHKCEFTDFSQSKNASMGETGDQGGHVDLGMSAVLKGLFLTGSGLDYCS